MIFDPTRLRVYECDALSAYRCPPLAVALPASTARKDEIVRRLTAAIGPQGVIFDPTRLRVYECDALSAYRCPPLAVALPASTA
ncbi:hypothetical protein CNY89_28870, partial [Amaricoccus sp. HAR-UPW-R2A-40]